MAARRKKKKPAREAGKPRPGRGSGGAKAEEAGVTLGVNLGHVFALRPRVSTSFRQADFNAAKHFLRDESYASIEDAARAVAEKALELTHDGGSRRDRSR